MRREREGEEGTFICLTANPVSYLVGLKHSGVDDMVWTSDIWPNWVFLFGIPL
jgi:hypothetical protein